MFGNIGIAKNIPALCLAALAASAPFSFDARALETSKERPVHTYSIVARDSVTGDMGVAVQSHWFSVGPVVPWARAGVGAVATQSLVLMSYGPLGLDLMDEGMSAAEALGKLVEEDAHSAVRQVAMVDVEGNAAAHTGDSCIAFASHHTGSGYSVQANMMLTDRVVPAMAKAYETAAGGSRRPHARRSRGRPASRRRHQGEPVRGDPHRAGNGERRAVVGRRHGPSCRGQSAAPR